jgi:3-oxosteroid 1-dehydrogenase
MLAGGGFAHRTPWRLEHHGIPGYSSASTGDLGTAIEAGQRAGGAVALMDDAWWGGSIPAAGGEVRATFLVVERSFPYSIIVDARGDRFANESESYVDLGHHMLEHAREVEGPTWMITDARHARRYVRFFAVPPGAAKAMREAGLIHSAKTLPELARAIGVDTARLQATVERFNGFARTGIDQDFGRGNSLYDRYYGDPLVRPNPNLGPLEKGPFTAVQVVPGDLGTKGGLLTDADARVLREDGSPVQGLYAAGNTSASVMGRTYPGPGVDPGAGRGVRPASRTPHGEQPGRSRNDGRLDRLLREILPMARAAEKARARRVIVNRAPVLTLWAAVVAQRLGFDREEALTLGRAVAGPSAYSKGRALGLFHPPPPW